MSMVQHVNKMCAKAFYGLYNIRQIRKFLSVDTTKVLVHAFVSSHLDYCNALLCNIPNNLCNRIQRVFNAAARVTCLVPRYDHISSTLLNLHWLPARYRIDFKILILVYKCLCGNAPEYLRDMIKPKCIRRYSLMSSSEVFLETPIFRCSTLGGRSFQSAGPRLWNKLPPHVRTAENLTSFKTKLKTYFFQLAFGQ